MPWHDVSIMSLRREFVALTTQEGANRRALCRHFGISPTTGHRWLRRYQTDGLTGLADNGLLWGGGHHAAGASDPDGLAAALGDAGHS